jgi:hypothetical protein
MRCPHCGQEHPDSTIFCPTTGRKLILTRYCSNCGTEVQESWRVCPKCGTPVAEITQSSLFGNKVDRRSVPSRKLIFVLLFASILLIAIAYLIFEQRSETPQIPIDVATSSPTATITRTMTITPTPTLTLTPTSTLSPIPTPVISWSKSVVEPSANRPGPFLSMDIGSDGTSYLAYFLDRNDDLKIVEGNGKSWRTLRNLAHSSPARKPVSSNVSRMALSRFDVDRCMMNFRRRSVTASSQKSQALIRSSISSFLNGSTGASSGTRGRGTPLIGLWI